MKEYYISSVIREYDYFIAIIEEFIKLVKTKQITEQFILRNINDDERTIKSLTVLLDEIKAEKNILLTRIKDIAYKYNDTDNEILTSLLLNKSLEEIANDLDLTEKYLKEKIKKLKRNIDKEIEIEGKGELISALCKILKTRNEE